MMKCENGGSACMHNKCCLIKNLLLYKQFESSSGVHFVNGEMLLIPAGLAVGSCKVEQLLVVR